MAKYNTYTYNDPNPIKRWLHRSRFERALKLLDLKKEDKFLDYGCGDGHFLKILERKYPPQNLFGYEPYSGMFVQAQNKLAGSGVRIYQGLSQLEKHRFNKIACLDTAEHLGEEDLDFLFKKIFSLMTLESTLILTVPIEIGLPSIFKNLYRYLKKKNYDNLNLKNCLKAIFGFNIERKATHLATGVDYLFSHIGFDHRSFQLKLAKYFRVIRKESRPFPIFGSFLNNTIYFLCRKK